MKLMEAHLQERFKEDPHVLACHAGLSAASWAPNYLTMQMMLPSVPISAVRTRRREKVHQCRSTGAIWLETLERMRRSRPLA